MSVSKMQKLTVIAPRDTADKLLRRLMRLKAVSLMKAEEEGAGEPLPHADLSELATRVARIEAAITVLAKHSTRKVGLFRPPARVNTDEFREDGRYETAMKVVTETEKTLSRETELRAQRETATAEMQAFTPYLDWEQRLDFSGTKETVALLGSLPAGINPATVREALGGCAVVAQVVCHDKTGLYLSLLVHKSEVDKVLIALSSIGFLKASFPDTLGTAKELFDRAERKRTEAENGLRKEKERLIALATHITDVEILYDVERTTLTAEEEKKNLLATRECTVLQGWCPKEEEARVIRVLDDVGAAYEFTPPAPGEDAPIHLKNNSFAKSFEWVLGMYSYPAYGRFDPTFVMSIFYFIIFGIMFADAGYGLLLSAVCFAAVRWGQPREGMKRFLLMFGYCGISCILFGVLFGAYFGNFPLAFMENVLKIPPDAMPRLSLLPAEAANVALLFDPLLNPMAFLIFSLAVGAVHLLAGMAVRAFILCRDKKVLDALFDIGSYWLLFAGLGVLVLAPDVGLWLTLGGVLAIVLTQGRHKKGILAKFIGGLGGLYGLIGYASDLLSYSRILALGLAAGVIGQVVNILATLKGGSVVGIILMIVVFTVGHLLNLVINVLGTFVHTSRLQYIEFFGKFYEDGGTKFVPLAPAERYSEDVAKDA